MDKLEEIIIKFAEKKVLVIGDVMLDIYVEGKVDRISPEAPVPILRQETESYLIGGAGNVAANISSLGGNAFLFSFTGDDLGGDILKKQLKAKGIEFCFGKCRQTIEKTRYVCGNQQMLRVDREDVESKTFGDSENKLMLEKAAECDVLVISDYAKGAITFALMDRLKDFGKKIIVDPKPVNKLLYKSVRLVKPNRKELFEMVNATDVESAGLKLRNELNSDILVTLGSNGMMLFSDSFFNIPTFAREVYDVTGAGDTVTAAIALSLASGADLDDAAVIANHAAGIAVERKGVYSVTMQELRHRIFSDERKIVDLGLLERIVNESRGNGRKIVWTNGCFDLLHIGHLNYLRKAKENGDILIVGINSDSSVKKLKGPTRPINRESDRAEMLAAMDFVDYVLIYPELDATKYLKLLRPHLYVKGDDYNLETVNREERKIVESYGGKILFLGIDSKVSTSAIIEKIRNS